MQQNESIRHQTGLSMNISRVGDKSPVQRGFFTNSAGDLLPALEFLGGLYNFCNYVFFNVSHDDMQKQRHILQIWKRSNTTKKRAAEIEVYENLKLRNKLRQIHCAKNHFLWFTLGRVTVMRISK